MFKLAVSTYSFSRFDLGPPWPGFERVVETCAELGIDGLELLGHHLAPEVDLHDLKALMARYGVTPVSVSANHNFVEPDPAKRRAEIDVVARWVDAAHEIGAPFVRAFGGRWNTRGWLDFMEHRGEEPPLPGRTEDEGFAWSVEAFKIASYYAGRKGVTLAVENHWGLTGTAEGVLRIVRETDSPWLRVAIDTGNFPYRPDPYAEMAALAPYAGMVHAKTYLGGGLHYSFETDFRRIGRILKDAGFRGYVSIEHEGKAMPDEALRHSVALLRDAFAGL
jgi:L-ribulose-5-phosphate 3-epimerase